MPKYDITFWNLNKNNEESETNERVRTLDKYAAVRTLPILTKQDAENPELWEIVFTTANEYVVYGGGNGELRKTALGIKGMRKDCYVVKDTLNGVTEQDLEELTKVGVKIVTLKDVLERRAI